MPKSFEGKPLDQVLAIRDTLLNYVNAVEGQLATDKKPAEPPKPALRVIKAADVVDEEKQRAADLAKRRKAAEEEAAAIRAMMAQPKRVLTAKKPEEAPKPEAGKEGIKGTIHKAAAAPGVTAAAPAAAKPGDKKAIKSEKLSSSWADDAAKKRAKYTYLPFGAGKRSCIGGAMSQVENTLALSILLRRFQPEYVGKEPPSINATVTLTPKGGLPFRIHELS